MKPHSAVFLALVIGASLGSFATYRIWRRDAVKFHERALKRLPHGYLVAESKGPDKARMSVNLQGNYGSNYGDPIKYYSGAGASSQLGTIAFGYPLADTPRFGDIIIVRFDLPDGTNKTLVVSNGAYGVLFENNQMVISYSHNDNNTRNRA